MVLPLVQMLLAAISIWWCNQWELLTRADAPDYPVAFVAVLLVNGPVSIARDFFYSLSLQWADAMYVVSIGVLWFWVAWNMDSLYERKRVVMFSWAPPKNCNRPVVDGIRPVLRMALSQF